MGKGVIIQASSRSDGDTNCIVTVLKKKTDFDVIDLNQKHIGHFDYKFKNKNDDFKPLFYEITEKYNTIIFATPIYWYTMSGLLKVFLDRISDFLYDEKDIGRRLRKMKMGIVSSSNENMVFDGFAMPFEKSAEYLGMKYLGHLHTWIQKGIIPNEVMQSIEAYTNKKLLANV
ncbi:flavodoxin family protein [Winogradskyella luteola]|uniref:NAD(P)H-dependent oxidoreductase n=1 Tax=Winogradskyella luteola TaxID=2828330 RepID=A0A9X1JRV1_9FLAO|nr:NAD(P)H-dependent oxidoreductase [Winogradskyella luteola]MBV7268972.1 NAD(P)H-dependent oxidoreductase [Winogradskyella luteola]